MPPQTHPQAQFVPISPDLNLGELVETTQNFDYVTRLPRDMLAQHTVQELEQLVLVHVVIGGKPLVIEGWQDILDPNLFSSNWLQRAMDKEAQRVRDIPNGVDIPMTMGHYLRSMAQLTNQFTPQNYRSSKRQRLYLKDIDTPEEWARNLKQIIPECVYYLNNCIEPRTGGDGAVLEPNEYGQMGYGKGVAPAGDLMSSLPPEMRAQNMMCYIGHEGTYTPAHREMCASLGHNIIVEASQGNNGEKEGSSVWFMTETKEREVVSEYFLSMLGHDIEVEKHFAQINAWKKAPFNVWVVEQKVGDLILIPPLAPHQVWNRGTRTMKAAWNRTTVDTLELAVHEALPRARLVCRDEQYKNKAIIYYTLSKYYVLLQRETVEPKMWKYGRIKQLLEDFKRLFALYTEVLVSEMFSSQLPSEREVELLPYDSNVTCSYCRCNIFNRFLTCKSCIIYGVEGEEDTYDICMECYAMGRSCACISNLDWVEQWEWSKLTQNYELWRQMLVECEGSFDIQKSPQPLEIARKRFGRKPVAQICQEELKKRPFKDPTGVLEEMPLSEEEPEVDDEGRVKKKKARSKHSKRVDGKTHSCHVCFHHEWKWKLAFCTSCPRAYCYGVLWRAFDLMPQEVMEDRDWICPNCLGHCSCGKCRKTGTQVAYAPKGTLLGHDTKKVADYRSVESLVDFSKTNLGWLREENDDNPQESARMKKLKERADAEKAREDVIDENYLDIRLPAVENGSFENNGNHDKSIMEIDPQLLTLATSSFSRANGHTDRNGSHAPQGNNGVNDESFGGIYGTGPNAGYPTKLLAPIASMLAPDDPNTSSLQFGQIRTMGRGFYEQEQDNGVDKIMYDPPQVIMAEASGTATTNNPNFALSDLMPPPSEEKKRKHHESADDGEFYTSKRQKHIVESKRRLGLESDGEASSSNSKSKQASRLPRRSLGKLQTYNDPGEDSMPYTADDIVVKLTRNIEGGSDHATKSKSRFARKSTNEKEKSTFVNKRKSMRTNVDGNLPASIPTPNKERKSLWLARREAEEAGENLPAEDNQSFNTSKQPAPMPIISVSSESESEGDNEGEDGSLFGDPDEAEKFVADEVEWLVSDENPAVKIASTKTPAGRPRGRPRKSTTTPSSMPRVVVPQMSSILKDMTQKTVIVSDSEYDKDPLVSASEQREQQLNSPTSTSDSEDEIAAISPPKRRGRPPKNPSAKSYLGGMSKKAGSLPKKVAENDRISDLDTGNSGNSGNSGSSPGHEFVIEGHVASTFTGTPKVFRLSNPESVSLKDMHQKVAETVSVASRTSTPATTTGTGFGSYELFEPDEEVENDDAFGSKGVIESALRFLGSDSAGGSHPVLRSPSLPHDDAENGSSKDSNEYTVNVPSVPSPELPESTLFSPPRQALGLASAVEYKNDNMSVSPLMPSHHTTVKQGLSVDRKDAMDLTSLLPQPAKKGPIVFRNSPKLSQQTPLKKKGPTVIRKSDDYLMPSFAEPQSPVVRKGPTVVRLLSEEVEPERDSSSESSSDDSIPAIRPSAQPVTRGGRGLTASRGMLARRGRGRSRGARGRS